ncbi:hypothetical protein SMY46_000785 [Cronobacter turicensis]|uniref:hypothetical protein n=1 Tax=Cronobacter turicensis TaxID=413502 RepID=UPI00164447CC|nr:hypothetical protein [Cronobacter turicensis]ELU8454163.1 hypothetical protein [Cronobacter turicensis]ELY4109155.1 hypothetical protein [Cronobacter turicensis]EMA1799245.1 hypothetical protein [Cronobacter turicensis]EMA1869187.1 hypothetical protein [Cronobacter turicensis]
MECGRRAMSSHAYQNDSYHYEKNDENSEISRLFSFGYESVEAALGMVSNTRVNSAEE